MCDRQEVTLAGHVPILLGLSPKVGADIGYVVFLSPSRVSRAERNSCGILSDGIPLPTSRSF